MIYKAYTTLQVWCNIQKQYQSPERLMCQENTKPFTVEIKTSWNIFYETHLKLSTSKLLID